MTWIQTYTGKKFYPLSPSIEDICIEDIAHALSMKCRFAGHCKEFYSVAQHSAYVSLNVPRKLALQGLLHDAAEAYLTDIPSPIKGRFYVDGAQFKYTEERLLKLIYSKYNIYYRNAQTFPLANETKIADVRMLQTERRDLFAHVIRWDAGESVAPYSFRIVPATPAEAKQEFLRLFNRYTE